MISKSLVDILIKNKIIEKDSEELYLYGFYIGFTFLQNIILTIVIGIYFNNIIQTIAFLAAYIPIRSFAGGYHAKTAKRCFGYSMLLIIAIEIVFSTITIWSIECILLLSVLLSFIINRLAPVQSDNKPLSSSEIDFYKNIVNVIICLECISIVLFWKLGISEISCGIIAAIVVESFLIVIAKFITK